MMSLGWIIACAVVSIVVLGFVIAANRRFNLMLEKFTGDLRTIGSKHVTDVEKLLKKELSPSIHLHDGPDAVAGRMQHIIKHVADDTNHDNRQITFYGAASLAAMPKETSDPEDTGEGGEPSVTEFTDSNSKREQSPSNVYWKAIQYASEKGVIMRRYISLFTEDEIRLRSELIQDQYCNWLKKQMQLLNDDRNYQLIDVPRAPQWGTNMARIIAKGVVMEITGNGRAAIVISDEHIADRIRKYARDAITGKNVRNEPTYYGLTIPNSLNEFGKRIQVVEGILKQTRDESRLT